jgi:hypothetical protein
MTDAIKSLKDQIRHHWPDAEFAPAMLSVWSPSRNSSFGVMTDNDAMERMLRDVLRSISRTHTEPDRK